MHRNFIFSTSHNFSPVCSYIVMSIGKITVTLSNFGFEMVTFFFFYYYKAPPSLFRLQTIFFAYVYIILCGGKAVQSPCGGIIQQRIQKSPKGGGEFSKMKLSFCLAVQPNIIIENNVKRIAQGEGGERPFAPPPLYPPRRHWCHIKKNVGRYIIGTPLYLYNRQVLGTNFILVPCKVIKYHYRYMTN